MQVTVANQLHVFVPGTRLTLLSVKPAPQRKQTKKHAQDRAPRAPQLIAKAALLRPTQLQAAAAVAAAVSWNRGAKHPKKARPLRRNSLLPRANCSSWLQRVWRNWWRPPRNAPLPVPLQRGKGEPAKGGGPCRPALAVPPRHWRGLCKGRRRASTLNSWSLTLQQTQLRV